MPMMRPWPPGASEPEALDGNGESDLCAHQQQRWRCCSHFAAARGVQRNLTEHPTPRWTSVSSFLFAVARGVQRNPRAVGTLTDGHSTFLFAVARGVQRNRGLDSHGCRRVGFYSLSRGAYSGTSLWMQRRSWRSFYSLSRGAYSGTCHRTDGGNPVGLVSIRCREGRTAERARLVGCCAARRVSIRCREGRTAEQFLPSEPRATQAAFLFAVARGVQRNEPIWYRASGFEGFYSLSRGAYSGTCPQGTNDVLAWETFLFAVARGVQRNSSGSSKELPWIVSIRCREGRTAEPYPLRRGRDQHKRCPFSHPTLGGTFARSPNTPSRRICAGQRLAHPRHLPLLQPPTTCDPGYLALPNRECG